ncbi:MAG TPA: endonuclease domain-containing protein [Dehalococcoidia bacterium]|nr:endonuclease domain-containing protein [Dehalococcoidia bacterium]
MATNYRGGAASTSLLHRSLQLRREATDAEQRLWRLLRGRQIAGIKFRRQHEYGPYILDFFCPERSLVVEMDGAQHLPLEGIRAVTQRTRYLRSHGIRVLRFTKVEVLTRSAATLEAILLALEGTLASH